MQNFVNKYFIGRNYPFQYTASSKAKVDAERIASTMGYRNIGLQRSHVKIGIKSKIRLFLTICRFIFKLRFNSILFLQYPLTRTSFFIKYAKIFNNMIVLLIHDINGLRENITLDEVKIFSKADVLIVHTPAMKKWFEDKGIKSNIVVLEIFDYLDGGYIKYSTESEKYKIAFAGNLAKSKFLDELSFDSISLNLYGVGIENRQLNNGVNFKGCFPPDKLAENIEADFGLVWDGESNITCSGILGEYLKIIAPHKLSMYISSGLPVIVWEESAMSQFVKKYDIGITINSLTELDEIVPKISVKQYHIYKKNVMELSKMLREGHFLKKALRNAEMQIL